MNSIENLKWRYAVKKFDEEKKLTQQQINIVKEAFNLTATSYGLQPIKLIIIQNKKLQEQLVSYSWNQKQVAQASHVLVFCINTNINRKDVENYFNNVKAIRNTPNEIINPFKEFLINTIENKTTQDLASWAKNQAYLAMGNLLTVCAQEKIDSCPMEGFLPEKYDEILDLKSKNLTSVLVLPIGYRAEDDFMKDQKKVRKNLDEMILEIR